MWRAVRTSTAYTPARLIAGQPGADLQANLLRLAASGQKRGRLCGGNVAATPLVAAAPRVVPFCEVLRSYSRLNAT